MKQLEALCHSTVDEDIELRRWAGLDVKENVNASTSHNDNGKEREEEEIVEPLEESADALLESLQETG